VVGCGVLADWETSPILSTSAGCTSFGAIVQASLAGGSRLVGHWLFTSAEGKCRLWKMERVDRCPWILLGTRS
jgi:hypothetical protein